MKINAHVKPLLEVVGLLLQMPSLTDPNTMLISQSLQSNTMVAQLQARNFHYPTFGRFLILRAVHKSGWVGSAIVH
jgi:hypothetical protein